jgi:hypothetical protein
MAKSGGILARFKRELQREAAALERQLSGIRNALAALEFGTGVGATAGPRQLARKVARRVAGRKRRKFSAATIAKMRRAQKARWAKVKKEK